MSFFPDDPVSMGTGNGKNRVGMDHLREGAMKTSVYNGNHPGKSTPIPIEPDLTTHEQGIPDKAHSSGEPTDAKTTSFFDPMLVRMGTYAGIAFVIWKMANSRI